MKSHKNNNTEEFKRHLLHSNRLEKFLSPKIRERSQTSVDRNLIKNCTFKPNLNATNKMNTVVESKINRQSSQANMNLTSNLILRRGYKSIPSSPEAQIGSAMIPALQHYQSNMQIRSNKGLYKQKTVVLKLNLDNYVDSDSSTGFNGLINNGYSQRSLERNKFHNRSYDVKPFRCSVVKQSLNSHSLSNSKSYQNLLNPSPNFLNSDLLCIDSSNTKQCKFQFWNKNMSSSLVPTITAPFNRASICSSVINIDPLETIR